MKGPTVLVVCNALDDTTRIHRGITTDSPAASRKVFMLCRALRMAGIRARVLSLGRGRADGSRRFFKASVYREHGIPVLYLPFCHVPLISELLTLCASAWGVLKLNRGGLRAAIFYNPMAAYVPALVMAWLAGFRNVLDLEDGDIRSARCASVKDGFNNTLARLYDRLCGGGALLACSALASGTRVRPVHCYYGTADRFSGGAKLSSAQVTVLMAGSLDTDTGIELLLSAIDRVRNELPAWAPMLRIEVTGIGPGLEAFRRLSHSQVSPRVVVHGRTSALEYRRIVERCDVGLALKPIGGKLADTTFPSKVIEFASAGLVVISTDISDVREVLGPGALYLTRNAPGDLVEMLRYVVEMRDGARAIARQGQAAVHRRCSPEGAGRAVADFIFE